MDRVTERETAGGALDSAYCIDRRESCGASNGNITL